MTTIVGVFDNQTEAENAVSELRTMGIADTDISYVRTNEKGKIEAEDAAGDTMAGATSGAITGGALGTVAGLAVANGILPGLGSLFVAGPLATAMGLTGGAATTAAGAMTGAAAGGLVGALTGLGVAADDAEMYEERVKGGDILVTARTNDEAATREIFDRHDADEVREY